MIQKLYLDFQFPTLNDYTKALKKFRLEGQRMKTQYTDDVSYQCKIQKIQPYTQPIQLAFIYYEKRANRDPDNIVFAKKFILDGLVNAGIVPNDTQKYIKKFTDEWVVDNKNTGVLVIIEEWQDDRGNSLVGDPRPD